MKRRNDPTSAKVSTILGSYDKAKELVTSSHMIGAILQPATPRPNRNSAFEVPPPPPPPGASSRLSHKQPAAATRDGLRPELSRQGVFERFQQSSGADRDVPHVASRQSAEPTVDSVPRTSTRSSPSSSSSSSSLHSRCVKSVDSKHRSAHVLNGRHKSSSLSSTSDSKHNRLKLAIPGAKVSSTVYSCSVITVCYDFGEDDSISAY